MRSLLICLHSTVSANHFNFQRVRMQWWDTSVSQIWSNSNCWGGIAQWTDGWLHRQRLWETIRPKATEALTLHEHTSRLWVHWEQYIMWRQWVWQGAASFFKQSEENIAFQKPVFLEHLLPWKCGHIACRSSYCLSLFSVIDEEEEISWMLKLHTYIHIRSLSLKQYTV